MKTEFLSRFSKDVEKIRSSQVRADVEQAILLIESCEHIRDLANIKKLTGHRNAYRMKIGDYRIGFFLNRDTVEFARVLDRKEIYKSFP